MADKTIPALKILRGKVGINIATPTQQLHVNGEAFISTGSTSVRTLSGIFKADTIENSAGASNLKLQTESGGNKHIEITPNGTGNVGINTNAPANKLQVNFTGDDGVRIKNTASSHANIYLEGGTGGTGGAYLRMSSRDGTYTLHHWINLQSNGNLVFRPAATGTAANQIIFNQNGSIGIGGTPTSGNKLFVNGNSFLDGTAYVDDALTVDGYINFDTMGDYLTFYGNANAHHSISSRNSSGTADDDIRINTYGGLFINLDSNGNDSSESHSSFQIGRHAGTGAVSASDLFLNLSGETGKLRLYKYGSGTHTGTAAYKLAVDSSGNIIETAVGAGQVDGSGTANYISKWTDGDTLGNASIYDNGSNRISLGTINTSPWQALDVRSTGSQFSDGAGGNQNYNITVVDQNAYTANYAGGILFGGKYNSSGAVTTLGIVSASKVSGNGNHGGKVHVGGRENGTATVPKVLTVTHASVGIGTTSPSVSLDIVSTDAAPIKLYRNSGNCSVHVKNNNDDVYFGINDYDNVCLSHNLDQTAAPFQLTSSGSLGLGTASASAKLHVNSSDDFLAYFKSSDNKAYIAIADDDTTGYISAENGLLSIGANTGVHASNLNADIATGRFGLGTTNPSHRLTVTGSTFSSSSIRLNRSDVGVDNDSGIVFDADTNATNDMGMGGIWYQNSVDNNYNALIRVRTDNAAGTAGRIEFHAGIAVGNSSTPRMVIKGASGNVGIGTTNPGYILDVRTAIQGAMQVKGAQTHGLLLGEAAYSTSALYTGLKTSYMTGVNDYMIISGTTTDGNTYISAKSGGNAHMRAGGNNSTNEIVVSASTGITYKSDVRHEFSTGNVGINTSTVNVKLAVAGQASFADRKLSLIGLDINSGGTPSYIKIRTKIPFASGSADFTVNIKGFRYGSAQMVDITVGWHYYNSTFYNPAVSSSGAFAPTIKLSAEDWDSSGTKKVCIVLVGPGYWPKLYVDSMYSSSYRDSYAAGWTWVDADATGTGNDLATLSYKSDFGNNFKMLSNGCVGIGGGVLTNAQLTVNGGLAVGDATYQSNMNNGAADFSVDCNGTSMISWVSNYLQVGGTGQNWSMKMYNGLLQTYSNDLTIIGGGTGTTHKLHLGTNGQTQTITCNNGKVGIGSATPTNKLTVNSGSQYTRAYLSQTADIHIANTSGSGSGAYAGALSFSSTDEANLQAASIAAIQTGSDQNQIGLTFNTQASEFGSTDLAEAVRIKHDGNIGIGTTDPSKALHVIGPAFIDATETTGGLIVKATSNANINLQAAQNTAYNATLAAHYNYTTPMTLSGYGGTVLAQNTGVTKTLLYANNAEQIRITATGVGIGLGGSDPTNKLHVGGSTKIEGPLIGVLNNSFTRIENFILDTKGEDAPVINHQLNNDLALLRVKGNTVTYSGLSSNPGDSETDRFFEANSYFGDVAATEISNASTGFTITLDSLPRNLTYTTRVGISFATPSWRCSYVKIEVYRAGAWNTIREETSNSSATVYQYYNTGSDAITKIRYTLKTPVTTSLRIVSLFAFNYNSTGATGYYLSQAGGTIYGQAGFGTGTFGSNNVLTITNAGTNASYSAIALGTATTGHGNSEGYWIGMIENGEAYLWNYESRAIIFGTSNVETMRIHSNANVSIGTTSSAYGRLFVDAATTAANTALAVRGRDSSASYIALNVMNNADGELFSILNNGRAKFTGSVGIGTGSPQTDLQIGDATGNPKLLIFGASHSSASSQILFGDWSASGGPYYAGMGIRYNSNHNKLHFDDNATSTNNTIMTLDRATQTVGIGTETPSAPLHIFYEKSTAYAAIKIRNFNNASACILYEDAYGNSEWATGHNYATNDWRVSQAGNSNTGLLEYPKLVVRNGGNVGIGSVFPEAKLVVNGDTYIVGNVGIGTTPGGSYKLEVNGAFAASSKNFVIDHPTKENKQLVHGSLEGPENGVYYRGRAQSSTIPLPDYWSGLVREDTITVQLTPRGGFQHLYVVSASLSQIVIGAAEDETIDCFYTIYGERADIDSLVVEKDV